MLRRLAIGCLLGAAAIGACTGSDPDISGAGGVTPSVEAGASQDSGGEESPVDAGTDADTDAAPFGPDCGTPGSPPTGPISTGATCAVGVCAVGDSCCGADRDFACFASCLSEPISWKCDDPSDCTLGNGCHADLVQTGCGVYAARSSTCSKSDASGVRLCRSNDECLGGQSCEGVSVGLGSSNIVISTGRCR